jgi:hypothetical protein
MCDKIPTETGGQHFSERRLAAPGMPSSAISRLSPLSLPLRQRGAQRP